LDGGDGGIGIAAGKSHIEGKGVICLHIIGRIFGIVIGYLSGIDSHGAGLAAGEVLIRVERVDWVGIRHHGGLCTGRGAGDFKPALCDSYGFTEGNHDITVFSERAAIGWDSAGDSRSGITSGRGSSDGYVVHTYPFVIPDRIGGHDAQLNQRGVVNCCGERDGDMSGLNVITNSGICDISSGNISEVSTIAYSVMQSNLLYGIIDSRFQIPQVIADLNIGHSGGIDQNQKIRRISCT